MTKFKGFATKIEAEKFIKNRGNGLLCYDKRTKIGKITKCGSYYRDAVVCGGLDAEKYPYCVQWNE